MAYLKHERGTDRLLLEQEKGRGRPFWLLWLTLDEALALVEEGGEGASARTPVLERDGTHAECPREANPQNYFHHAFHEDAKPGDLRGRRRHRMYPSVRSVRSCSGVSSTSPDGVKYCPKAR